MTSADRETGIAAGEAAGQAAEDALAAEGLRVARGNGTPEEQAAALAVLAQALQEAAGRPQGAATGPSAWARSQRGMRGEVRPARGAWRGFSG